MQACFACGLLTNNRFRTSSSLVSHVSTLSLNLLRSPPPSFNPYSQDRIFLPTTFSLLPVFRATDKVQHLPSLSWHRRPKGHQQGLHKISTLHFHQIGPFRRPLTSQISISAPSLLNYSPTKSPLYLLLNPQKLTFLQLDSPYGCPSLPVRTTLHSEPTLFPTRRAPGKLFRASLNPGCLGRACEPGERFHPYRPIDCKYDGVCGRHGSCNIKPQHTISLDREPEDRLEICPSKPLPHNPHKNCFRMIPGAYHTVDT